MKTSKNTSNDVSLSLKDLCHIIKACRKSNVLSLKYQGLEVNLSDDVGAQAKSYTLSKPASKEALDQDSEDAKLVQEIERMEYLKINDPLEYERIIAEEMNAGQ